MCEKITLAGVLEIHVEPEHVKVYTVYRNDTQRRTYGEDRMECKTSLQDCFHFIRIVK